MRTNTPRSSRQRLAVAQYERRQAIFEASGMPASLPPPARVPVIEQPQGPRDKFPTLDDLTGPEAPRARWKLVVTAVGALAALAEVARQLVGFLGKG